MKTRDKILDEIMEAAWMVEERKELITLDKIKKENSEIRNEDIEFAAEQGLLDGKEEILSLTSNGRDRARKLIRRHRLAERLLSDVLEMDKKFLEEQACEFEHILSAETADSICTLLNHPRECPHGGGIPEGECCRQYKLKPERVVVSLSELKSGEKGKILYYISGGEHKQIHQLIDLGIAPGEEVTVHQTFPSAIIRVHETEIALDRSILKRIFVRRINQGI